MTLIMRNLFVVAVFLSSAHSIARIPLYRMQNPTSKVDRSKLRELVSLAEDDIAKINISNFQNNAFYGEIGLGTPPQTFKVLLDTGSANLFVPSSKCPPDNEICSTHARYTAEKSETYQADGKKIVIGYVGGNASGYLSKDTLTIGNIQVEGQTFAEILDENGGALSISPFDGIMGLGWPSLSEENVTPPIQNMIAQNLLDQPVFGFHIKRDLHDTMGGELTIGGVDEDIADMESAVPIPITRHYFWHFNLDHVELTDGSLRICANGCKAIADSGTNKILGPKKEVLELFKRINASYYHATEYSEEIAMVDCGPDDVLPDLSFVINGVEYILGAKDYTDEYIGETRMLVIGTSEDTSDTDWILGSPFHAKFYTVYDVGNSSITFAPLKK